jgi:Ca2+-binding EF-hand superfamily protein
MPPKPPPKPPLPIFVRPRRARTPPGDPDDAWRLKKDPFEPPVPVEVLIREQVKREDGIDHLPPPRAKVEAPKQEHKPKGFAARRSAPIKASLPPPSRLANADRLMTKIPRNLLSPSVALASSQLTKVYLRDSRSKMVDRERLTLWSQIAFREFDINGDGDIKLDELGLIFEQLDIRLTREQLEVAFACCDLDGNGSIDEAEFTNLVLVLSSAKRRDRTNFFDQRSMFEQPPTILPELGLLHK